MLKIRGLTKKYESKQGITFALDNVSLEFNKNEFVFIVGKSGSGKSTLLNILGSLDKPTSGEILLNDEELNHFDSNKINTYRQNIAFIFQDFALIDNLNVKDNIKLARNDISDEDIKNALAKVELPGFESRKIQTLSAGQKQRVAIARGIVKHPKIILCDEPTGNLDFLTSQSIIKCLKTLTNDSLVLFVSHNLDDAYTYANRIIELDNGKISRDIEISNDLENKPYVIENESLYLTTIKSLSEQEIDHINQDIKAGKINKIHPKKELFKEHDSKEAIVTDIDNKYKRIKFKDLLSFSNKVLRKQFIKTSLFALVAALVLSVFSIAYGFISFNPKSYTKRSLDVLDENALIYKQEAKDTSNIDEYNRVMPLTPYFDERVEGVKFVDYFPVVNIEIPAITPTISVGPTHNTFPTDRLCIIKERKLSFNNSCGTVVMTEDAFSKYLNGGEPFEIVETASEYKDYGVYITDVAMKWLKRDRIDYLGEKNSVAYPNKDYFYGSYINGVVKTNLEDRYPEFKEYLYKDVLSADDYKTLTKHPNFNHFIRTFARYATYYYSFNKNFLEDYKKVRRDYRWLVNYKYVLEAEMKNEDVFDNDGIGLVNRGSFSTCVGTNIPKGYCNVSIGMLNTYLSEEGEHTKEEWQDILDQRGRKLYVHNAIYDVDGYTYPIFEFTIHKITDAEGVYVSFNNEDGNEINNTSFYEFGFVSFESKFYAKNELLFEELSIRISNSYVTICSSMAKSINAYKDLFKVVFYIMLVAAVVVVFIAAYDAIRKQTYSIGVMKSLGLKDSSIFGGFAVHQIEFVAICSILVLIAEAIFIRLANDLLAFAFQRMYSSTVTPVVPIIEFTGFIYLTSMGIILLITLLSLIFSVILIKKAHIVDILKNKY